MQLAINVSLTLALSKGLVFQWRVNVFLIVQLFLGLVDSSLSFNQLLKVGFGMQASSDSFCFGESPPKRRISEHKTMTLMDQVRTCWSYSQLGQFCAEINRVLIRLHQTNH